MLDFLNSLGKKMISQPERVSTDTYSDAITGQVKDTVVDYVENFPIADSEFYSKLGTGVVGSALSIPAEAVNIASYVPYSPYKVIRELGVLEPFQKPSMVAFLKNLGLKASTALGNPDNPAFTTTGNVGERYAEGLASDVLLGFSPAISKLAVKGATKIPSKLQDLAERTQTPISDMMDGLAIAGISRKTPLSQFGAMVNPTGIVRSEMAATPKRTLDENYFYNKAEDIAKNLTQEKGTSKQFLSMFKKEGVTDDELNWSGLGNFLKTDQPVTKEAVLEHLADNQMSVTIKDLNESGSNLPSALTIERKPVMEGSYYTEMTGRIIEDMFEAGELRGAGGLTRILLTNYGSFNDTELKIVGEALNRGYINEDLEKVYPPDTVMMNDMMNEASEKFLESIPLTERQIENWWKSKAENRGEFTAKDDDLLQDLGLLTPEARAKAVTDYRMQHQPRGGAGDPESIRLDDLTKDISGNQAGYPSDFYTGILEARSQYGGGVRPRQGDEYAQASNESIGLAYMYRKRPDAKVTMYRAVPNDIDQINEGDFVTLSSKYAKSHASSGYGERGQDAGKVISKDVYVRDLYWATDDINEYGYFPTPEEAPKNWKEALHKGKEEYAQQEYNTEDYQQIEVSARLPNSEEILYSVTGNKYFGFYDKELFDRDVFHSRDYIPEDPNELTDVFYQIAREDGYIGTEARQELYEDDLTPKDFYGSTRESYSVNVYEDTSEKALDEFLTYQDYAAARPKNLQSHFFDSFEGDFPIGHARSTIRDLNGQGVEFEDDYLKYKDIYLDKGATKSSNLDGRVYAIHEIQSDIAQALTSSRSDDYTASGLKKKKDEVRKIIGKNPESKMMEFDDRAEAIREKGNEFVKNLNQWQQSTPSKLTQEDYTVRDFKKGMGHLETETHPEITDHLFRLLVERGSSKEYREIRDYLDFENKNEYQTSADTPYSLLREKEELAVELQNLEKDTRVYKDAQVRLDELERIKPNIMEAPYIGEKRKSMEIILKGEIAKAVDANVDYVTLGEPEFNKTEQYFKDAKEFYGVAIPRTAEKLLKPLDPDIKIVNMYVGTGEVVKGFKITEKLKKSLREQGQSFFAPFAAIGAGILGNKVANEEERSYE